MSRPLKDLTLPVRCTGGVEGLLQARGASPLVLLNTLRLTEAQMRDPHQTIDGEQLQRALVVALPYCQPGQSLAAQYLAHAPLAIIGPLADSLMSCATFDEALDAVARCCSALFPAYDMRKACTQDKVHIVVSRLSDFGAVDDLLTEIVLGLFTRYQAFLAEPLEGIELHFRHRQWPQPLTVPCDVVSKVQYGSRGDMVVFPKRLMRIRLQTESLVMQVEAARARRMSFA